jgi:predicted GNAT family acetyltransferase
MSVGLVALGYMTRVMSRVVHNADESRYELFVDDKLASIAEYRRVGSRMIFHHTETATAFRGRGLAAELVEWAMTDVREQKLSVVPQCWFVRDFLDDHPEFQELVDAAA